MSFVILSKLRGSTRLIICVHAKRKNSVNKKINQIVLSDWLLYQFNSISSNRHVIGGQGWIRTIVLKWEQISYYYSFHYQIKFVCSLDFLFIFFKIPGIKSLHSEISFLARDYHQLNLLRLPRISLVIII